MDKFIVTRPILTLFFLYSEVDGDFNVLKVQGLF